MRSDIWPFNAQTIGKLAYGTLRYWPLSRVVRREEERCVAGMGGQQNVGYWEAITESSHSLRSCS